LAQTIYEHFQQQRNVYIKLAITGIHIHFSYQQLVIRYT